jgi:molybdopterin converting factor small subunit
MRRVEGADVDAGVVEVRAFFDLADRVGGLTLIEVESVATSPTVESVAEHIGLPQGSVAFAMVNGCMADLDIVVAAGDRVALFPDYVPYHKVYGTCVI